jgi:hypothetical protein
MIKLISGEPDYLGKGFEEIVGKKLGDFPTLTAMEKAIEAKGYKLRSQKPMDPEELRKQANQIIEESYQLLNNLE